MASHRRSRLVACLSWLPDPRKFGSFTEGCTLVRESVSGLDVLPAVRLA